MVNFMCGLDWTMGYQVVGKTFLGLSMRVLLEEMGI
jgi:hypothetical protein